MVPSGAAEQSAALLFDNSPCPSFNLENAMDHVLQAYLDDLEVAGNIQQLRDALTKLSVGLGLTNYAYLALPNSPYRRPRLISNYDPRWTGHYLDQNYHKSDPIILRSLHDPHPFRWGADLLNPTSSRFIHNFFHEAANFGICSGLTYPMGRWRAGRAALTFASDSSGSDFLANAPEICGVLRMVAFEFHKHFRRLVAPGYNVNGAVLSLRQVQCLEWIAVGKTIPEVALLLGIARSTAKHHLEVVREKLDVCSSAQAVAALANLRRII